MMETIGPRFPEKLLSRKVHQKYSADPRSNNAWLCDPVNGNTFRHFSVTITVRRLTWNQYPHKPPVSLISVRRMRHVRLFQPQGHTIRGALPYPFFFFFIKFSLQIFHAYS